MKMSSSRRKQIFAPYLRQDPFEDVVDDDDENKFIISLDDVDIEDDSASIDSHNVIDHDQPSRSLPDHGNQPRKKGPLSLIGDSCAVNPVGEGGSLNPRTWVTFAQDKQSRFVSADQSPVFYPEVNESTFKGNTNVGTINENCNSIMCNSTGVDQTANCVKNRAGHKRKSVPQRKRSTAKVLKSSPVIDPGIPNRGTYLNSQQKINAKEVSSQIIPVSASYNGLYSNGNAVNKKNATSFCWSKHRSSISSEQFFPSVFSDKPGTSSSKLPSSKGTDISLLAPNSYTQPKYKPLNHEKTQVVLINKSCADSQLQNYGSIINKATKLDFSQPGVVLVHYNSPLGNAGTSCQLNKMPLSNSSDHTAPSHSTLLSPIVTPSSSYTQCVTTASSLSASITGNSLIGIVKKHLVHTGPMTQKNINGHSFKNISKSAFVDISKLSSKRMAVTQSFLNQSHMTPFHTSKLPPPPPLMPRPGLVPQSQVMNVPKYYSPLVSMVTPEQRETLVLPRPKTISAPSPGSTVSKDVSQQDDALQSPNLFTFSSSVELSPSPGGNQDHSVSCDIPTSVSDPIAVIRSSSVLSNLSSSSRYISSSQGISSISSTSSVSPIVISLPNSISHMTTFSQTRNQGYHDLSEDCLSKKNTATTHETTCKPSDLRMKIRLNESMDPSKDKQSEGVHISKHPNPQSVDSINYIKSFEHSKSTPLPSNNSDSVISETCVVQENENFENGTNNSRIETAEEKFKRLEDQAMQQVYNAQFGVGEVRRSLRPNRISFAHLAFPCFQRFPEAKKKKVLKKSNGITGKDPHECVDNVESQIPHDNKNGKVHSLKRKRSLSGDHHAAEFISDAKCLREEIDKYPRFLQDNSIENSQMIYTPNIMAGHRVFVKFNVFSNSVSGRSFLAPFFNIGGSRHQFDVEDMEYINKAVVECEKEDTGCARHIAFGGFYPTRVGRKAWLRKPIPKVFPNELCSKSYERCSYILEGYKREKPKEMQTAVDDWEVDQVGIEIDCADEDVLLGEETPIENSSSLGETTSFIAEIEPENCSLSNPSLRESRSYPNLLSNAVDDNVPAFQQTIATACTTSCSDSITPPVTTNDCDTESYTHSDVNSPWHRDKVNILKKRNGLNSYNSPESIHPSSKSPESSVDKTNLDTSERQCNPCVPLSNICYPSDQLSFPFIKSEVLDDGYEAALISTTEKEKSEIASSFTDIDFAVKSEPLDDNDYTESLAKQMYFDKFFASSSSSKFDASNANSGVSDSLKANTQVNQPAPKVKLEIFEEINADAGLLPEKTNTGAGLLPEKSNTDAGLLLEKTNTDAGLLSKKTNTDTGLLPKKTNTNTHSGVLNVERIETSNKPYKTSESLSVKLPSIGAECEPMMASSSMDEIRESTNVVLETSAGGKSLQADGKMPSSTSASLVTKVNEVDTLNVDNHTASASDENHSSSSSDDYDSFSEEDIALQNDSVSASEPQNKISSFLKSLRQRYMENKSSLPSIFAENERKPKKKKTKVTKASEMCSPTLIADSKENDSGSDLRRNNLTASKTDDPLLEKESVNLKLSFITRDLCSQGTNDNGLKSMPLSSPNPSAIKETIQISSNSDCLVEENLLSNPSYSHFDQDNMELDSSNISQVDKRDFISSTDIEADKTTPIVSRDEIVTKEMVEKPINAERIHEDKPSLEIEKDNDLIVKMKQFPIAEDNLEENSKQSCSNINDVEESIEDDIDVVGLDKIDFESAAAFNPLLNLNKVEDTGFNCIVGSDYKSSNNLLKNGNTRNPLPPFFRSKIPVRSRRKGTKNHNKNTVRATQDSGTSNSLESKLGDDGNCNDNDNSSIKTSELESKPTIASLLCKKLAIDLEQVTPQTVASASVGISSSSPSSRFLPDTNESTRLPISDPFFRPSLKAIFGVDVQVPSVNHSPSQLESDSDKLADLSQDNKPQKRQVAVKGGHGKVNVSRQKSKAVTPTVAGKQVKGTEGDPQKITDTNTKDNLKKITAETFVCDNIVKPVSKSSTDANPRTKLSSSKLQNAFRTWRQLSHEQKHRNQTVNGKETLISDSKDKSAPTLNLNAEVVPTCKVILQRLEDMGLKVKDGVFHVSQLDNEVTTAVDNGDKNESVQNGITEGDNEKDCHNSGHISKKRRKKAPMKSSKRRRPKVKKDIVDLYASAIEKLRKQAQLLEEEAVKKSQEEKSVGKELSKASETKSESADSTYGSLISGNEDSGNDLNKSVVEAEENDAKTKNLQIGIDESSAIDTDHDLINHSEPQKSDVPKGEESCESLSPPSGDHILTGTRTSELSQHEIESHLVSYEHDIKTDIPSCNDHAKLGDKLQDTSAGNEEIDAKDVVAPKPPMETVVTECENSLSQNSNMLVMNEGDPESLLCERNSLNDTDDVTPSDGNSKETEHVISNSDLALPASYHNDEENCGIPEDRNTAPLSSICEDNDSVSNDLDLDSNESKLDTKQDNDVFSKPNGNLDSLDNDPYFSDSSEPRELVIDYTSDRDSMSDTTMQSHHNQSIDCRNTENPSFGMVTNDVDSDFLHDDAHGKGDIKDKLTICDKDDIKGIDINSIDGPNTPPPIVLSNEMNEANILDKSFSTRDIVLGFENDLGVDTVLSSSSLPQGDMDDMFLLDDGDVPPTGVISNEEVEKLLGLDVSEGDVEVKSDSQVKAEGETSISNTTIVNLNNRPLHWVPLVQTDSNESTDYECMDLKGDAGAIKTSSAMNDRGGSNDIDKESPTVILTKSCDPPDVNIVTVSPPHSPDLQQERGSKEQVSPSWNRLLGSEALKSMEHSSSTVIPQPTSKSLAKPKSAANLKLKFCAGALSKALKLSAEMKKAFSDSSLSASAKNISITDANANTDSLKIRNPSEDKDSCPANVNDNDNQAGINQELKYQSALTDTSNDFNGSADGTTQESSLLSKTRSRKSPRVRHRNNDSTSSINEIIEDESLHSKSQKDSSLESVSSKLSDSSSNDVSTPISSADMKTNPLCSLSLPSSIEKSVNISDESVSVSKNSKCNSKMIDLNKLRQKLNPVLAAKLKIPLSFGSNKITEKQASASSLLPDDGGSSNLGECKANLTQDLKSSSSQTLTEVNTDDERQKANNLSSALPSSLNQNMKTEPATLINKAKIGNFLQHLKMNLKLDPKKRKTESAYEASTNQSGNKNFSSLASVSYDSSHNISSASKIIPSPNSSSGCVKESNANTDEDKNQPRSFFDCLSDVVPEEAWDN